MEQNDNLLVPAWYDGRKINEVMFCEEFLRSYPMKCIQVRSFTVDGPVDDEDALRMEIYESIKYCMFCFFQWSLWKV